MKDAQILSFRKAADVGTTSDVGELPPDLLRRMELLAAVARRTGNAVVVTDASGRIEWVNPGFTRLTEFEASEVVGKFPGAFLQGNDTDPATRAMMARAIAAREPFDVVVLNYTKSGKQYWVRIEAEPTVDREGRPTGYMAIETDVTEQRIAEGRDRVAKQIGDRLLTCDSIEHAAGIVVQELVRTLDVRTAQTWLVEPGRPYLKYLVGACATKDGQTWLDVSASRTFRRGDDWIVGVGAPGVAWGTGRPCAKTDFWEKDSNGQYSRRATAAIEAGIRTVCAVPVHGPHDVVAVLEIGGSHNYPGFELLPSLVERVSQQLGAFILQHQNRAAFQALFHQSPDALLVLDEDSMIRSMNHRAVMLFGDIHDKSITVCLPGNEVGEIRTVSGHARAATPMRAKAIRADGSAFSAEVTTSISASAGAAAQIVSVRDLTEQHAAEEATRRSLAEKVTLVQEVHHRVKNNLQIISSLVSLQADDVEDESVRNALLDTARRIQSMAFVHQQLYANDDLSHIHFGEYARALCTALCSSMAPHAELHFDTDEVNTRIEVAVPAGIILNELLTNAFKHGVTPDGQCIVHVCVERSDNGFSFTVRDEGPGISGTPYRKGSMGQTLIHALVRQLRAKRTHVTLPDGEPGAAVRIEVPDADE